jgi:hypothetical protein
LQVFQAVGPVVELVVVQDKSHPLSVTCPDTLFDFAAAAAAATFDVL